MNDDTMNEKQNEPAATNGEPTELEKCAKEREEYLNGWKRAKADLANYQKDEQKRFEDFAKFASADLVRDCITVLDSFDLAMSALEKDGVNAGAVKGIAMIRGQMEEVLKRRGLEVMNISPGGPFNPALYESIGEMESTHPPGTIAEVVARGYLIEGRVVRPAKVRLSNGEVK